MTLRFCFLTTFYPPHNFGGDGIAVQRLARALAQRGHHVTVIHDTDAFGALHRGPVPEAPPDPYGVEVIALRSGLGWLSSLMTQQAGRPLVQGRRIRQVLANGRFDVINFHNISLVGGPGLLSYGTAVKLYMAHEHWLVCPTHVLWRHGRELCDSRECLRCVLHYRRPPQLWRFTGYLERQLRHVDAFVAMSEFSRRKHREFGFSRDMEVLPPFLPDADAPTAEARERPHPRPFFLYAGRLEQIKGLQDVIPLFDFYQEADLLVAGDGEHRPRLQSLAAGNARVRFLGRVPTEDLGVYYRHAVATIVPSIGYETFGMTLIESFRQKTPVIARRLGPFPEIVEQSGGGALFSTADELLAAMRRFAEDPTERDRCGEQAFIAFSERWSEIVAVPKYLEIVRRAAARRAGRFGLSVAADNMSSRVAGDVRV